ncbi:putative thiol methyltransferase protein [Neofusicoccum parvum UCRNP2]|uniref:Thiopurine S-methyltransferase n=2 Tax=Neofusicoccum parvum TaxID=310453 RepID=A0ACB5RYN7_9PEZI|nr:putative thiol methyltransferase protein [Neofusicoccum parvum UCRNP2]GME25683.1 Thiopurine S-methyltransferase [Neofusicoccum parvum]
MHHHHHHGKQIPDDGAHNPPTRADEGAKDTYKERTTDAREKLLAHFSGTASGEQGARWDDLWKEGDFLPWDRGFPNPALHELLATHVFPNPHRDVAKDIRPMVPAPVDKASGRRRKALVPGCGKGYDVVALAAAGYDAWGLEVSPNAVEAAKKWVEGVKESNWKKYETIDKEVGRGSANFVVGDFFKDDWLKEVGGTQFDLIYDYTFLSALPPDLRPAWSLRMSRLLSHEDHTALICIEFPTYKPPSTGGPPFGLPPKVYEQHLSRPGEELKYGEDGHIIEERDEETKEVPRNKDGLIRVTHYQPNQTHEIGKGTDWVSIWRHPDA